MPSVFKTGFLSRIDFRDPLNLKQFVELGKKIKEVQTLIPTMH